MKKSLRFAILIILILIASVAATFVFLHIKKAPPPPEAKVAEMPKIAFVIDDFGYNMQNLQDVFELKIPVTLSILPNLGYSGRIAEEARKRDYEVILHLPLEPKEENMPIENSTIFCDMERERVLQLLEEAITSVPNLAGISNHMGSKATEDARLMRIVFEKAKEDGLFFMDSLVTPDSICDKLAAEIGIGYVHRSVFLDNEADPDYIRGQIKRLIQQAQETGWAVGIGHDRTLTLLIIKEMIPELEKDGIEFVFLSDLAE